ncbi:hypothetical protein FRX31_023367, partial [Thalictrum thalictroides]
ASLGAIVRKLMGVGIDRFKRHLAGGDPNVETCTKQSAEVRFQFRELVGKSTQRKNAKTIAKKQYRMKAQACSSMMEDRPKSSSFWLIYL